MRAVSGIYDVVARVEREFASLLGLESIIWIRTASSCGAAKHSIDAPDERSESSWSRLRRPHPSPLPRVSQDVRPRRPHVRLIGAPLYSRPSRPDRPRKTLANRMRRSPLHIPRNQLRIIRPHIDQQMHMLPPNRDGIDMPIHLRELPHHRLAHITSHVIIKHDDARRLRRRVRPQPGMLPRRRRAAMVPRAVHPVPDRTEAPRITGQPCPKRRPRDMGNTGHACPHSGQERSVTPVRS